MPGTMGRLVIPGFFVGEVPPTRSVLMIMLEGRYPIMHSCRRGLCGQDLIRIVKGWEHLNPVEDHEDGTLTLLQVRDKPMRMACCTKVIGDGEVIVEVVRVGNVEERISDENSADDDMLSPES